MSIAILQDTNENYLCFERFKKGDEQALAFIHQHTCKLLAFHGKQFIDDDFTVNSMVQETYIKAWDMRSKIETMFHLYCFMKMNLSWLCLKWLKHPRNAFLRKKIYYTNNLEIYSTWQHNALAEMEQLSRFFDEERIDIIEKVIPYLAPGRQTMIDLYFKQGLSYKAIARRFATSNMAVHAEVQKGLEQLKTIINRKKKNARVAGMPARIVQVADTLDQEMTHIYRLRLEHKMGFATIAQKMNLEQGYVQRKYIEAHALLTKMGMAV